MRTVFLQASLSAGIATATMAPGLDFQLPDCVDGPLATNGVCNRGLTRSERAKALIHVMNIEEKLGNLQNAARGAPRIGLPEYEYWNEALHGVAPGHADFRDEPTGPPFDTSTQFPMPILIAAAFDGNLIKEVSQQIGMEARSYANGGSSGYNYWMPTINPLRDPRWGRGSETPGEDALVASRYAETMVHGLEGDERENERLIIATPKHFAANDLDNWNGIVRHSFDAKVSAQDLAEYYLAPFQAALRDAQAGSVMTSYNAVNGVPASANEYLMQTILKEHWSWNGTEKFIVSDCGAVGDIARSHKYVDTDAEGVAEAWKHGMDLACENHKFEGIKEAYEAGLLTEKMIDASLQRLYEGLIQVGYFDWDDQEFFYYNWDTVNTEEAQSYARLAVEEGMVLLKNDGVLPIRNKGLSLAMIGFWADEEKHLHGDYAGKAPYTRTPVWAANKMEFDAHVATGPALEDDDARDRWTENALEAADMGDYILFFGGLSTDAAAEGKDRTSFTWPEAQVTLLRKLSKLGKPIIVVQLGDIIDNTPLLDMDAISAVVWTSWPGQEGGTAIMNILTGKVAPAGRLPVTMYPAKYVDAIPMDSMSLRPVGDYPGRTYRWYDDAVQAFGFGLHYTSFDIAFDVSPPDFSIQDLVRDCQTMCEDNDSEVKYLDTCPFKALEISIKNTGSVTSDFVVLVFLKGEYGPKPYPLKTLASFHRMWRLEPGERRAVDMKWTLGNLARRDEDGNTVLFPGEYTVILDEPAMTEMTFTLTGKPAVLDKWPAPRPDGELKDDPRTDPGVAEMGEL